MKYTAMLALFGIFFLVGCSPKPPDGIACTMEVKLCPDGTEVGRQPPTCEFAPCPETEKTGGTSSCNYDSEIKKYVGKSAEECSRIKFQCTTDREFFEDECGCGCILVDSREEGKLQARDCMEPRPEICTAQYAPVCGWFDPAKIQCVKYPCARTFDNSCNACADENVISWTAGECPSG